MLGALILGLIDTRGLQFEFIMEDVAKLNDLAFEDTLEVSKISYFTYAKVLSSYVMMNSGSALGQACGPLLIAKREVENIDNASIAIPGYNTTANMLLSLAYPKSKNKEAFLFSEIEDLVLSGAFDLGLIIHENRFTYETRGLKKIRDLGEFWEDTTDTAIPLGGIAIKRDLDKEIQLEVESLIRESIEFAYEKPTQIWPFIKRHAQEMDDTVIQQHIDLYVNNYSIRLGEAGEKSVNTMFDWLVDQKMISKNKARRLL